MSGQLPGEPGQGEPAAACRQRAPSLPPDGESDARDRHLPRVVAFPPPARSAKPSA